MKNAIDVGFGSVFVYQLRILAAVAGLSIVTACGSGESGAPASAGIAAAESASVDTLSADLSGALGPSLKSGGAVMELTVSDLDSSFPRSEIRWLESANTAEKNLAGLSPIPGSLEMGLLSSTRFDRGAFRYFSITYRVRNAPACVPSGGCLGYTTPRRNPTFLATMTTTTISQTAVSQLTRADGSSVDPLLARSLLPTNVPTPTSDLVDPAKTSLQVFQESELPAAASGVISVFPYGFVATNAWDASRTLPANPAVGRFDGVVSFGFRFPLSADPARNPTTVAIRFQTADDTNSRATQSLGEQNFAGDVSATRRAMNLGVSPGSEDLVVLGGRIAQSPIGNPICRVRSAGQVSAPLAYLADTLPTTPLPVMPRAAPMNLEFVRRNQPLSVGYCENMVAPTEATFYVRGSHSGPRRVGGVAGGTLSGGVGTVTPNQLIWKASNFFAGEEVSFTVTNGNRTQTGLTTQPWVGHYRVQGSVAGSSGSLAAAAFVPTPGSQPAQMKMADLNGDGFLDVVFVGSPASQMGFMAGSASGAFAPAVFSTVPFESAFDFKLVDVNRDGRLDYVATGLRIPGDPLDFQRFAIGFGNGTGGFGPGSVYDQGYSLQISRPSFGDLNSDGTPDMVIDSVAGFSVRLGNGTGAFGASTSVSIPAGRGVYSYVLADIDGDGRLDIVTHLGTTTAGPASTDTGALAVYRGRGDGTFLAPSETFPAPNRPGGIEVGDMNGDGRPDVVQSNWDMSRILISLNIGSARFGTRTILTPPAVAAQPSRLKLADLNGDSRLDVVTINQIARSVSVHFGDGLGGIGAAVLYPLTSGYGNLASYEVVDFNRDGRLDVIVGLSGVDPPGAGSSGLSILRGL